MNEIGFIGLGTMGVPIALNLARAGQRLVVWNRTAAKHAPLVAVGASAAGSLGELFERCALIIMMPSDEPAIDGILDRDGPAFIERVSRRTLVNMATVSADYSAALSQAIERAGGRYVEAPVSGSRRPAELAELVAMVAGERAPAEQAMTVLSATCRKLVYCGAVPNALRMKHATNLVLIPTMIAVAEAAAYARRAGLPLEAFGEILLAGQMASDLLRAKIPKVVAGDFSAQASVVNVLASADAALAAVDAVGSPRALIAASQRRLVEARDEGLSAQDALVVSTLPGTTPGC